MKEVNTITITATQQELIDNFNFFTDWLDKYQFLIDLGKKLPDFPASYKIDQYKVRGCQSSVWMFGEFDNNNLVLHAVSDSAIVNGLIYLLLTTYSNHTPAEILNAKPDFIAGIGLDKHLSPTRKNGLYAMLQAVKNLAVSV
jgi:cysteine desulfuration protein SufE